MGFVWLKGPIYSNRLRQRSRENYIVSGVSCEIPKVNVKNWIEYQDLNQPDSVKTSLL